MRLTGTSTGIPDMAIDQSRASDNLWAVNHEAHGEGLGYAREATLPRMPRFSGYGYQGMMASG
jgi:hypothetical protein